MAKRVQPSIPTGLKILVYGIAGSGKTRLLSSAALDERMSPALMLDAGANPVSIRNYPSQPDIIRMEELEDFNDPYDWMSQGQPEKAKLVKDFDLNPPYRTIIVDHVTEVQRMYFDLAMYPKKVLLPGSMPRKREWGDYNKVLYGTINFARLYFGLADLGIHVLMAAQEREASYNEDGTMNRPIGPSLEGQGQVELCSFAEAIARMQQITRMAKREQKIINKTFKEEEVSIVALFKQSSGYHAKDQYGPIPDVVVNPTMEQIMDWVYNEDE